MNKTAFGFYLFFLTLGVGFTTGLVINFEHLATGRIWLVATLAAVALGISYYIRRRYSTPKS